MFIHRYPIDILGTKFKDGFGYGDFNLKGNTLTEEENMSTHKELIGQKFDTKIILKGNDKYTQVVSDDKTHQQTTETHKRVRKYSMFQCLFFSSIKDIILQKSTNFSGYTKMGYISIYKNYVFRSKLYYA